MQIFDSYGAAFQDAIDTRGASIAHLHKLKKNMNIDTSACYKVFFLMDGVKRFHIDNGVFDCHPGDLILVAPEEWHYFSSFSEEENHERKILFFHPDCFSALSSADSDLSRCFSRQALAQTRKISLEPQEQKRVLVYTHRLTEAGGFGQDLLDRCCLTELLVYLNRLFACHNGDGHGEDLSSKYSEQISGILSYINSNLSKDLSLDALAGAFFLSPSYLCRVFRDAMGTTPHKYICAQRITLAKELLAAGMSVTDVCTECGFNDYSNFIKVFTKNVGISPKRYAMVSR